MLHGAGPYHRLCEVLSEHATSTYSCSTYHTADSASQSSSRTCCNGYQRTRLLYQWDSCSSPSATPLATASTWSSRRSVRLQNHRSAPRRTQQSCVIILGWVHPCSWSIWPLLSFLLASLALTFSPIQLSPGSLKARLAPQLEEKNLFVLKKM